jgi:hypothetical protein
MISEPNVDATFRNERVRQKQSNPGAGPHRLVVQFPRNQYRSQLVPRLKPEFLINSVRTSQETH